MTGSALLRALVSDQWTANGGRSSIAAPLVDGRARNATNTGFAGDGVSSGSLTPVSGNPTYSTTNQAVTGKSFTGLVTVTASGVTFKDCLFAGGGANWVPLAISSSATNCVVDHCTFAPTSGQTFYIAIHANGSGTVISKCDISGTENGITIDNGSVTGVTIDSNYIHDLVGSDNDCIEVYAGTNVTIKNNYLYTGTGTGQESSINIAPWQGSVSVSNCVVQDNFMDGGNTSMVVDLQSTGTIHGTKVVRNWFGGHNNTGVWGRYMCLQNNDSRSYVNDDTALASSPDAIEWPSSGTDANHWWGCSDLTPDRTNAVAMPGTNI